MTLHTALYKMIFCHLSFHITRFFFSSLTLLASAFLFTHLFSALRSLSTIKTHVRPHSRQPYHTHALTPLCRRRVPLRLENLHLWLHRRNCHVLHLHCQHCSLRSCCSCRYVDIPSIHITGIPMEHHHHWWYYNAEEDIILFSLFI